MKVNQSKADPSRAKLKRVLIVEDEPSAREATGRYLEHCGFEVAAAASAKEAVQRASELGPEVVVCDWQLAGGDNGAVVARQLQSRFGAAIIFVTAHPLDELRDATRDLDVATYLRKPISLATLAATINDVLSSPA